MSNKLDKIKLTSFKIVLKSGQSQGDFSMVVKQIKVLHFSLCTSSLKEKSLLPLILKLSTDM